ncbi:hypothetical protein VTJ04DRAFT_6244 [Mycothermus thermophilus]
MADTSAAVEREGIAVRSFFRPGMRELRAV